MLLRKKGFPEEGDLLLCTVTKIYFNSVFVNIDEYDTNGMMHISEISPGRIRNINDYVTVDKKIICKVIKVDKIKGHIDLSLRRVNEIQRRNKLDEIKQEQKAEKIIESLASELKQKTNVLHEHILTTISKKYDMLHTFFQDLVIDKTNVSKFDFDTDIAEKLDKIVRERIKPPKVEIKGNIVLKSYDPEGVEIVKYAIEKGLKKDPEKVQIKYFGGGKYSLIITSEDYKDAEKILKSVVDTMTKFMEKNKGVFEFQRLQK